MKKLYAGFFCGEYGWELMRWQGYLRYIAKDYDYVCVGCEPGHESIYDDFATDFVTWGDVSSRNMWMCNGGHVPPIPVIDDGDYILPSKEICLTGKINQTFIQYGKAEKSDIPCIVFHARATNNLGTHYRNWSIENWLKLESMISNEIGPHTAYCIGSIDGANNIRSITDQRGLSMPQLFDVLAMATVLVTPSSGPGHLAALCNCPVVAWSDNHKQVIGCTNKERYKHIWNPFNTPVEFLDKTWQPKVEDVFEKVKMFL